MKGLLDWAHRLALRVDVRRLVLALGAAIVFLGVMGILRYAHKDTLRPFNLDGERNVPAFFSGALWVCAGSLAALVGRAGSSRAAKAWYLLAALLFLVAADEVAQFHEHLEHLSGIDWQILYAPIALLAAPLWIVIGRRLHKLQAGFHPFVAATLCALVSQGLEPFEVDSTGAPKPGFRVMVVTEELLEMAAAVLLGVAFLAALRAVAARAAT